MTNIDRSPLGAAEASADVVVRGQLLNFAERMTSRAAHSPASVAFTAVAMVLATTSCNGQDANPSIDNVGFELRTVADCPEGYNIIEGTDGDDNLKGTSGNDCILGYDGDDRIRGREGDDYLVGGRGEDKLYGQSGDDFIYGERDADVVSGGSGEDTIRGGGGDDVLRGDNGDDDIRGGNGDDFIRGGGGNDELYGNRGNDDVRGDAGDDVIYGGDDDDRLNGGRGDDTVYGGAGNDTIVNSPGNDTIVDEVGDANIEIDINTWPVVDIIVPSPTRLEAGETASLTTLVSDPDGDPLGFFWTADCAGAFSANDVAEPTFTLTAVDDVFCTLTVEVTDGRGGQASGSIKIRTGSIE